MSPQIAKSVLQALIILETYALLALAWDRFSALCRQKSGRRRFWSNFIFDLHTYIGFESVYRDNPFVFLPPHRPTLID